MSDFRKVQEIMTKLPLRYRIFNTATRLAIERKINALGYCEDDEDLKYLMDALSFYRAQMLVLAKPSKTVVDSISDMNLKTKFVERLPGESNFNQIMISDLDMEGRLYDKSWEEDCFEIRQKIYAQIQPLIKLK